MTKNSNSTKLPVILVTGASGFVGSHFINAVKDDFFIFAIARRSQQDAGIPLHHNVRWLRCDIADAGRISYLFGDIAAEAHVEHLFHFAGIMTLQTKNPLSISVQMLMEPEMFL